MNHPRAAIREALTDHLKNRTDAKDKVFGNRNKPLFDNLLPAILVYARSENVLEERFASDGFGATKRELDIAIEAVISGDDNLDEALDKIAAQIESAFEDWEMPTRKADILKLKSTEIDTSIEGSKIYGAIRLNYSIIYYK